MNTMTSYLIILVIIILLSMREKEVRPATMWIVPALFIWQTVPNIAQSELTPLRLLLYLICLIFGLVVGFWRGKLETVRVNPASGKITSQGSVAGVAVFMGIMLLRMLAGYWGKEHALISLTTALLLIPLGTICARRYVIYLKYKQILGRR